MARRGGQAGDHRVVRATRHSPAEVLGGANVVVVGLFSAKEKQYRELMDELAVRVTARGANVVGVFVQRRGVSDGGVSKMDSPFSRRTLIRSGKVREIADACRLNSVRAVVFSNALTAHQRQALEDAFSCPVLTAEDIAPSAKADREHAKRRSAHTSWRTCPSAYRDCRTMPGLVSQ